MEKVKKILILIPYYLPGYKSGGPQRTIENLVEIYGMDNSIYVLTQDHDLNCDGHYEGIRNGEWVKIGNADVMYVPSREYKWRAISEAYRKFDVIYSCGLFEQNSVSLLLLHRLSGGKKKACKKVYIASMGVFSDGAFQNRSYLKKKIFIGLYKVLGFFKNIVWSFTTREEEAEAEKKLRNIFEEDDYIIAEDLPRIINYDYYRDKMKVGEKRDKRLNLVYISRISPQKNLLFALKILNSNYDGEIYFDIFGIKEDLRYWRKCEDEITLLPSNIKIRYRKELKPDEVVDTFAIYDAFLFPTKGENYGHTIYESLSAGCIPIISDQTPWKDARAIIHRLDDIEGFRADIHKLLNMDSQEIRDVKLACIDYAQESYSKATENSGYNILFQY